MKMLASTRFVNLWALTKNFDDCHTNPNTKCQNPTVEIPVSVIEGEDGPQTRREETIKSKMSPSCQNPPSPATVKSPSAFYSRMPSVPRYALVDRRRKFLSDSREAGDNVVDFSKWWEFKQSKANTGDKTAAGLASKKATMKGKRGKPSTNRVCWAKTVPSITDSALLSLNSIPFFFPPPPRKTHAFKSSTAARDMAHTAHGSMHCASFYATHVTNPPSPRKRKAPQLPSQLHQI